MERRKRNERLECRDDRRVDSNRTIEADTAMHDAMADGHDAMASEIPINELQQMRRCADMVERMRRPALFGNNRTVCIARNEMRGFVQPFDLAVDVECEGRMVSRKQRELDARRPGIDQTGFVVRRRRCATSIITAVEASRSRTGSAREVSTMGTRVPSTMPAVSAPARY